MPPAVVVGLDCITGLQTARILAGHGIPVIGVASDPGHFCCRTKVCQEIVVSDTVGEGLIETLEGVGSALSAKGVLFPCTDMSVLQISRCRGRLEPWYHVLLPEHDVVEMLMDKIRFYTYAIEADLPIPGTFLLHSRQDAEAAAAKLTFPCMLKPPMKTARWLAHSSDKVHKADTLEALLALYDRYAPWAEVLMAQEWIEGSDAALYSCNCYFNADSEALVTFVARKLRQWPPEAGTSCLGEEVRNDVVLEETVRLFRGVNYRGLGYVEMKRDERTGKHYIIEPNIGRPTGRSAIAEAGGVALLYTMYCDAVGLPLPSNRTQRYTGVKWIYLRRDLQSAFYYWRRGELSLKEWWRSLRGRKGYAVLSREDWRPFMADLQEAAGKSWRAMRKRGSGKTVGESEKKETVFK